MSTPALRDGEQPSTLLGQWYATAPPWRPQVALLVNELTLLPVLMPVASAATLPARAARTYCGDPGRPRHTQRRDRGGGGHLRDYRVGTTAHRSVVGIMTEFRRLAALHRDRDPGPDLTEVAHRLATTPCSPLYGSNVSPDRELAAFLPTVTSTRSSSPRQH